MGLRTLAEAIILQSVEDLWVESHRGDCLAFFNGEGFDICASMADIGLSDRSKLMGLICGAAGIPTQRKDDIEYSVGGG